ncbi:hypothetical protein, partial [Prevotella sp.]|uniref:hypothetical protein n=1 Tax=Prevotella sp. TaxID=59823 RepID=UPI002580AFEE
DPKHDIGNCCSYLYICWCIFKYTIFAAVSFRILCIYHSKFRKNHKISIKRDIYSAWGEIDGDKMMLQFVDDGKIETMVFTKR